MTQPAPTLLRSLNNAATPGAVTLAGLSAIILATNPSPAVGAATVAGLAPAVVIQTGPSTGTELDKLTVYGRAPSLKTIRTVSPSLPMGTPVENDLTPVIAFLESTTLPVGVLSSQGLSPTLTLIAGGSTIKIIGVGAISASGLAPTINLPPGQESTKETEWSRYELNGLEPSLVTTCVITPELTEIPILGSASAKRMRVGWSDVPGQPPVGWTAI